MKNIHWFDIKPDGDMMIAELQHSMSLHISMPVYVYMDRCIDAAMIQIMASDVLLQKNAWVKVQSTKDICQENALEIMIHHMMAILLQLVL